jgi:hypothetical protein
MEFGKFLLILFLSDLVIAVSISHWNVFGWHANLGISDEQAAQLYQTNPDDPQIIAWKNALQFEIDRLSILPILQ